jgi:hypothetical protein
MQLSRESRLVEGGQMNAHDILMYGNRTLLAGLDGIPTAHWMEGGACGWWSVKDIMAHLSSYETCHAELLANFVEPGPTPTLDQFREQGAEFNKMQVATRQDLSPEQVLGEYSQAHDRLMAAVSQLEPAKLAEVGTIPWYGESYGLDDLLVYSNYGHKREHASQINLFKDRLG